MIVLAAVQVSGSSLIVGMPVLVAAVVTSLLEVLVVPLKVVSLHTTVTLLPLEVMASLFLFVGVAFLKDAVVVRSLRKWKLWPSRGV